MTEQMSLDEIAYVKERHQQRAFANETFHCDGCYRLVGRQGCLPYRLAVEAERLAGNQRLTEDEFYERVNGGTVETGFFGDVHLNARLWRFLAHCLALGGVLADQPEVRP